MGLNDTPSGERIHIGFFGRRNAGKSSVVNAVTGQDLAVVSDTKGTTTDPVSKSMELLPLGPVVIIDTPGFDDEGSLGALRIRKTRQTLNRTDLAVLIVDVTEGLTDTEEELIGLFREKELPWILVWNKSDLLDQVPAASENQIYVSAEQGTNIYELKELMAAVGKQSENSRILVRDLIRENDVVLLVMPIDSAAPKGRMILPQQMMIRDVLDGDGLVFGIKEDKVREALEKLEEKPALVITDSQAFERVAKDVPEDIPLTSFSILMARYKGFLETAVEGVKAIGQLKDGDTILISEGCTHHRQCGDIGTVKLPAWLKKHTGKDLKIETSAGKGFPEDLSPYALIIHCGGCMLNEREVRYRMKCAMDQNIPFTNYGICIAQMKGILERSLTVFSD